MKITVLSQSVDLHDDTVERRKQELEGILIVAARKLQDVHGIFLPPGKPWINVKITRKTDKFDVQYKLELEFMESNAG